MKQLLHVGVFLVTMLTVNADFTLTINFINYTNPSGLCAECNTRLAKVAPDQIVPVCCDQTSQSDNCDNTGEESCDTRFRWTLREFGASIETRPATVPMADNPPYSFNPCSVPTSMCPFSETSRTFDQGDIAFLGRPNPYLAYNTTPWTGRIQFFIEPNDGIMPGAANIIDSIMINLDTLQLGADFTEEMTYTGFHNISQIRMNFKVECSPNYCGPDCTVSSIDNPRIMSCASNGQITCVNGFDLTTNCTTCLFGWDSEKDCTECLPGWNMSTNCTTCLFGWDSERDCTECLPGWNMSTNCTTCLFGWDSERDCTECLTGWNMSTNCTTCLSGYTGDNCIAVVPVTTSSTTGSDITTSDAVDAALVGGIAGGVGGGLIVIIILLVLIIILFACRKTSAKSNVSGENASNVYEHNNNNDTGTGTASSIEHKFENPIYTSGSEPNEVVYSDPTLLKTVTKTDDEHMVRNTIYNYATVPQLEPYSQLRQPTASVTSQHLNGFKPPIETQMPLYDTANFNDGQDTQNETSPQEDYSRLHHPNASPSNQISDLTVTDPSSVQPVYDVADFPSGQMAPHPSKSSGACDRIPDEQSTSNKDGEAKLPVYDVAFPEQAPYALLDGPTYDVTDHKLHSPNPLSPLPAGMYGVANFPDESTSPTSRHYDYADILNKTSTSEGSVPRHAYDYVDTILDTPQPPKEDTSVYTNTLPGVITAEAVDHYDFGPELTIIK